MWLATGIVANGQWEPTHGLSDDRSGDTGGPGRTGAVHIKRLGSDLPRRLVTQPRPRRTLPSLRPSPRSKHRLRPSNMRRAWSTGLSCTACDSCSARTCDLRADAHQTACTRGLSRLIAARASGGYVDAAQAWGVRTARPSSLSSHLLDARAGWRLPPPYRSIPDSLSFDVPSDRLVAASSVPFRRDLSSGTSPSPARI
jgi:hypothetical protein